MHRPSVIIGIDFEKAFDSLEWSFVERTLSVFNFGPSIIKWVQTFYKDSNSYVLNNGWASQSFRLQRGVCQGCPLSPYLFILTAEVLSCFIRKNNDIKGITIDGVTHKICQYADDTILCMPFDQDSIDSSLLAFEQFQNVSGLKVNYDKSEIFPICSIKHTILPLYNRKHIKWSPQGIIALGINVSHDTVALVNQNYMPLIIKLENVIKIWSTRDLTIYGTTSVIKAHL